MPRPEDKNRPDCVRPAPQTVPGAPVISTIRSTLQRTVIESHRNRRSTLISSNNLANKFIFERWGIRSSQRQRYRNLFNQVRTQSRSVMRQCLDEGKLDVIDKTDTHRFDVYKFDDIRGNLILGFIRVKGKERWDVPPAGS